MVAEAKAKRPKKRTWNYHPDLPIAHAPVFVWPPQPRAAFLWLTKRWITLSGLTLALICAVVFYAHLLPDMETMKTLSIGWIGPMYVSNVIMYMVFASVLHLYLYTFTAQGQKLKFDARALARKARGFTFNDQVLDNMFWSVAGTVTAWTVLEVLYFWGAANGYIPTVTFADAAIWIVVTAFLIPPWASMHFYWIHRMLHWRPLYKTVHHLHHRNINVGPWSGLSMHPVEGTIFLTSVLIHFVLPTHPVVVLLHFYARIIGPTLSHAGFEKILFKNSSVIDAGHFHHQLHHRYFECNYGTPEMPWDEWFGSFHDGTEEATSRIKERRRKRYGGQTTGG